MPIQIPKDNPIAKALTFNPTEAFGPLYADAVYFGQKVFRATIVGRRKGQTQAAPKDAYVSGSDEDTKNLLKNKQEKAGGVPVASKEAYVTGSDDKDKNRIKNRQAIGQANDRSRDSAHRSEWSVKRNQWSISIVDLDYDPVFDARIKRPRSVDLHYIPKDIKETPGSTFATLAPLGRNNPHYQFTGSEDTLEFELDWHSKDEYARDVISLCKWVQALTKADGWKSEPHTIKLVWSTNPLLWRDDIWLVTVADTRYTQLSNKSRVGINIPTASGGTKQGSAVIDHHLLPVQAYQKLVLKKVTKQNATALQIGQFTTFQK